MPDSPVAGNLRAELARQLIPHSEIATVIDLTPQAMSRRMRGEVSFRDDELVKIAKHLGVDVASLFTRAAS